MKKIGFSLVLIYLLAFLSGCSSGNDLQESPTIDPLPTITAQIEPTISVTESVPTTQPTNVTEEVTIEATKEEQILQKAKELLSSMSMEEKVGQMFFVRCPEEDAIAVIQQYHMGGYLLFGRDFKDKSVNDVVQNIKNYQEASNITMFIGVDEEGGTVTRISRNTQFREGVFASPQELYLEGGFDRIVTDTQEKSTLLTSLGINVNFAPVCDISTDSNDFIYKRAFGKDAALTSEYVKNVVNVMQEQKVFAVLKHFPGYGNNVDTHTGIAIDERSYDKFEQNDFLPFQAGIEAGAEFVLVSHNVVKCMDTDYPASLSFNVHKILRENLGFDGIIITDDLSMDAIGEYTGDSDAAVLAVLAGNDMLCCTNFEEQIPAVIAAVEDGTISQERLDESVLRILVYKLKYLL